VSPATPAQVRQWSEEVAADPDSLAFLPLARAYREQGRRDAAVRLCVRGLERHPDNVDAHHLLGLLYRESGDPVKAFDEWDIALALDADHAPSRREIGLLAHARGEWPTAVRHLERARQADAFDEELRLALEDAWARSGRARAPAAPSEEGAAAPPPPAPQADAPSAGHELDAVRAERGIIGAIVMDAQGFVLGGRMEVDGVDHGPEVAALLGGASSEAERAVQHLGLGAWRGILVESAEAVVRLAPVDGGMVVVAGRRDVPTGWVLRVAQRARAAANRLLGGPP
jgi:tetratricopeptide (TPR) repeat protein